MGKTQSWDNAWDVGAMSNYNTITSLAESPIQEGLIYAGTDDGIMQITEDGGSNWRKVELGSIKGVPATAFVNDVRADLYDAGTVYAALDNHKYGDFKPYLVKSTDKGRSWSFMNGDLPSKLLTWRLVQDHVRKELLFAATEYGIYFTVNGGTNWIKLKGGLPTISFRDIAIHRRENDLVGASFGRGFYVLDDITPIRNFQPAMVNVEATMFTVKPAYWYVQKQGVYGRGHAEYSAENPPFGAVFNYYLADQIKSLKEIRQEKEKKLAEQNSSIPFPGWNALEAENRQDKPQILFTIKDANGNIVNTVAGKNKKGFNRVNWDLSYASRRGERLSSSSGGGGFFGGGGIMATPGTYSVTMSKMVDGKVTQITDPMNFEVVPLGEGALKGASYTEINSFREEYQNFQQDMTATNTELSKSISTIEAMHRAAMKATKPSDELVSRVHQTKMRLMDIDKEMHGDETKGEIGERSNPTPGNGNMAGMVALRTTYGPTANHKAAFQRANEQLQEIKVKIKDVSENVLPQLERDLKAAGAPWIEGQGMISN
jgi:hypothetical protein